MCSLQIAFMFGIIQSVITAFNIYGLIETLPYQVLLIGRSIDYKEILCGGTLLNKLWILTAAHCTQNINYINIYMGSERIYPTNGLFMRSHEFLQHEKYEASTAANDIALVKLPQTINFTKFIQPAILPYEKRKQKFSNMKAITVDWTDDTTNDNSTIMDSKKLIELLVISNAACFNEYGAIINDGILCAKGLNDKIVCLGDSGGPLILQQTRLVIGITSFGPAKGCDITKPVGFTRVTYYLDWITAKITQSSKQQ